MSHILQRILVRKETYLFYKDCSYNALDNVSLWIFMDFIFITEGGIFLNEWFAYACLLYIHAIKY
jgi:hypothetical protein